MSKNPFRSSVNNCSTNTFQYVSAINSIQQYSRPLVTHDWHLSSNSDWMWGNSAWSSKPNINPTTVNTADSGTSNRLQEPALSFQVFCHYFVQWAEVETWQPLFSLFGQTISTTSTRHNVIIFENLKTCHRCPTICSLIKSKRGSSARAKSVKCT